MGRADFRRGTHGLAALAAEVLGDDPFSGVVLVSRTHAVQVNLVLPSFFAFACCQPVRLRGNRGALQLETPRWRLHGHQRRLPYLDPQVYL